MLVLRRVSSLLLAALVLVVACGRPPSPPERHGHEIGTPATTTTVPEAPTTSRAPEPTTTVPPITAAPTTTRPPVTTTAPVQRTPPAASPSFATVMECIKAHESGDYTIHNHPPDGSSGAFQIIGPTWRSWSARAGYGGYQQAWEAPPAVQDAVVVFMLGNGGAHNWDPRYGNDPCTVNL